MYQGALGLLEPDAGDWFSKPALVGGSTVFQPAPAPIGTTGSTWLPKPPAILPPPPSSSSGPTVQPPAPLPVPVQPGPVAVVVADAPPAPFGLSWGKLALGAIGLWALWRVIR